MSIIKDVDEESDLLEEEEEERDKPDRELELKKPFLPVDIFEKTKLQRQLELEAEIRRQNEENSYFPPFWNQNKTW